MIEGERTEGVKITSPCFDKAPPCPGELVHLLNLLSTTIHIFLHQFHSYKWWIVYLPVATLMPQVWWAHSILRYLLQFICTIHIPIFTGFSSETGCFNTFRFLLFIFDCFIVLWNCRYVPSELDYCDDFIDPDSFLSWMAFTFGQFKWWKILFQWYWSFLDTMAVKVHLKSRMDAWFMQKCISAM